MKIVFKVWGPPSQTPTQPPTQSPPRPTWYVSFSYWCQNRLNSFNVCLWVDARLWPQSDVIWQLIKLSNCKTNEVSYSRMYHQLKINLSLDCEFSIAFTTTETLKWLWVHTQSIVFQLLNSTFVFCQLNIWNTNNRHKMLLKNVSLNTRGKPLGHYDVQPLGINGHYNRILKIINSFGKV